MHPNPKVHNLFTIIHDTLKNSVEAKQISILELSEILFLQLGIAVDEICKHNPNFNQINDLQTSLNLQFNNHVISIIKERKQILDDKNRYTFMNVKFLKQLNEILSARNMTLDKKIYFAANLVTMIICMCENDLESLEQIANLKSKMINHINNSINTTLDVIQVKKKLVTTH